MQGPRIQDNQRSALMLLQDAGILPIVTVESVDQARRIAEALQRGGLKTIELTLRTPEALPSISALKRDFPDLTIGAGTVLSPDQIRAAHQAGADFLVTPGASSSMLTALAYSRLPAVIGVATVSDVLELIELGFSVAKLFPAAALGGVTWLKALQGPLPHFKFCPTGGINELDAAAYLAQPNVACVGGSWMVPQSWLQAGEFDRIASSAAAARLLIDAAAASRLG